MKALLARTDGNGWRFGFNAALCLMLSCARVPPWTGGSDCPVVLMSSTELRAPARLRARVRIAVGDREIGIEVVALKGPEELVVVGIAPQGTRLFAVRQRGRDLEIDASSRQLEQLAHWVMDALHRGFWIEPVDLTWRNDEVNWIWEGEEVVEIQQAGHRRREFRRAGNVSDVAPVAIDYRDRPHPGGIPGFEIRNAWCGYEAIFVPLDEAD